MSSVVVKVLLTAVVLVAAGCASVDPVVKIGLVAPFEGRHRAIGYDAIYSARLAVREINQAGGIGGYRIGLVALDDRGDLEFSRTAAASLILDQDVVAVVGHFLPETTGAAADLYGEHDLGLVVAGLPPLEPTDPATLSPEFLEAYAAVTPFDETAGPYAGPTYEAFELLWSALAKAEQTTGTIARASVQEALGELEYQGMTGTLYPGLK